jgi:puromycin-sensitive aminopeptidase
MSENLDPYHLPRNVIPSRYDLTLQPDLQAATFTGSVIIALEVVESTDAIWLNAADLEIISTALEDGDGNHVCSPEAELVADRQRLRLGLGASLPPGGYRLILGFEGILNDKLRGFYRSVFKDNDGNEHVIATTQFESTDARRAFPCFDEPDFKAVFGVTLIVPDDLYAVSNGPIISETPAGNGWRLVSFDDTMKMSTYLVAFIVGPFEATEAMDVDGVPLRVVHPVGKGHLTEFALAVGAFTLRHFAAYYDLPYPGQKLDLVAIPDFAFGAMENLGCVTFREVLLLLDPQQATQPERVRVADVIAHEIAHMWFGDLVTMRWWNGIWLNEAFATFMGTMAVDAFDAQWQRWVQFSLERSAAFDVDSLHHTRPIEYAVQSPSDADGMFDLLTYEKGGSVLRMLEQHLDATPFRDGIRHYLKKHQYANTETNDLWDAIEEVTGEPARRVMDSWIFQRGFPLLSVASNASDKLTIRQQRFSFTPLSNGNDAVWSIPVTLRHGHGGQVSERRELLESASLEIDLGHPVDWVVVNAGGHGFYRVRYAPDLLQRLRPIMLQQLTAIERYSLVDDAWASVLSGTTSAADFLALAQGLRDENDLDVWTRLCGCLEQLGRLLDGEAEARYQAVLRDLYAPALERLGWTPKADDTSRTLELRGLIIRSLAVTANDAGIQEQCRDLHASYMQDSSDVEPNVAAAAAAAVACCGNTDDYGMFVERFKTGATPQEVRRYQNLLALFPGADQMAATLAMSLDGTVRTQDAPYLVAQCLRNPRRGEQAWRFVRNNWDAMLEAYPNNAIVRMLDGVKSLSLPAVAADVAAFFDDHEVPQGQLTLLQHLERLQVNVALREREAGRLGAALLGQGQGSEG